jgi:peroxiredoxin
MVELGELERSHEQFARRNVQVVVVSLEGLEEARKNQDQFPHLRVVSDQDKNLASRAKVIDENPAPTGAATAMPTTFLIDRRGVVRHIARPDRFIERFSPEEVLRGVDEYLPN